MFKVGDTIKIAGYSGYYAVVKFVESYKEYCYRKREWCAPQDSERIIIEADLYALDDKQKTLRLGKPAVWATCCRLFKLPKRGHHLTKIFQ